MSLRLILRSCKCSLAGSERASFCTSARALHSLRQNRHAFAASPALSSRRSLATPPPQVKHSELPTHQYNLYSDATMDKMLESLENILDEVADPEYEVEYGSGVLTLKLGSKGTYVVNKQPPNKQIWLSSPFSGPKRYDFIPEQDDWIYARDGRSLNDLLNEELGDALSRPVDLGLGNVSTQVG